MLLIALAKVKETLNNAKNMKTARRLRLGMYQLFALKDAGVKVTDNNGGGNYRLVKKNLHYNIQPSR